MAHWKDTLIALLLFVSIYATHASFPVVQSSDSAWALPTALSLVNEGDFDLNEYRKIVRARKKYGIRIRPKRKILYNFFPYGTTLLVTPVVALFEAAPDLGVRLVPGGQAIFDRLKAEGKEPTGIDIKLLLEKALASLIVACCALLWYLIARQYLSIPISILLVLSFSFATPALSTASRGLWQHGPVMLLYSVTLLLLIRFQRFASLTALPLAFGYLVRPTTIIVWAFTAAYHWLKRKRDLVFYLLLSFVPIIPFFLINRRLYGRYLSEYYRPGRLGYHDGFFEAVAASLFSPNRGLLFQSPFLLLSLLAVFILFRTRERVVLIMYCLATIFCHLILTSLFPNWWHGHSFGSRYMTDILPFFFLLTVFVFEHYKQKVLLFGFLVLTLVALPIHYKAATSYRVYKWNVWPRNVDEYPSRVWELKDAQFLR